MITACFGAALRHPARFLGMVGTIFALGILAAAAQSNAPASQQQAEPQMQAQTQVVVTGEGSVSAPPDYAQIRGGVTTKAKTAKEAMEANAKAMTAIMAALRDGGIEQKDIQTSEFSVQPVYAQPQPNTEPRLVGFNATNQVSVAVRQIGRLGDVLDRMVSAGATNVGNIEFLHSDLSKTLDQAREAAVADARRKAELYVRAAGASLGSVAWISESGAVPPFMPMGGMMHASMAPTPIAAGADMLHVTVSVGYGLAH